MTPLTIGDPKTFKASFTRGGQPARVDGTPAWGSSNPAILTVTPASDGLSATVTPVAPGDAQVTLTAQAGGTAITATPLDCTVALPHAEAATIVPA